MRVLAAAAATASIAEVISIVQGRGDEEARETIYCEIVLVIAMHIGLVLAIKRKTLFRTFGGECIYGQGMHMICGNAVATGIDTHFFIIIC